MTRRSAAVVTMKLDTEDYENIYLRVRGKMWRQAIALLTFFGLGVAGAGWLLLSSAAKSAINHYVQSDLFKDGVRAEALSRIEQLDQRSSAISQLLSQQEKAIGNLANLPISAGPNGLSIVDPRGNTFNLATGEVAEGESVTFPVAFKAAPIVIVTELSDEKIHTPSRAAQLGASVLSAAQVTTQGFKMQEFSLPRIQGKGKFKWLSIGS